MSVEPDDFRAAMAHWASGVTIVAARFEGRIVATTVSAFASLSLEPALVLLAVGANATILPFLARGATFGVSILAEQQRRLATVHADPFPVGPSPFPEDGDPLVAGALVGLLCTVTETRPGGDHVIVLAAVDRADVAAADGPLIRYDRAYHRLRR